MGEVNYPTPHIAAKPDDFGNTVIMPGDPLRSKFIAENFLNDAVPVNDVRGVQGYTGVYEGVRVSVMASGMGMPSMGIYSHELFSFFGVDNILRVGSAGAMQADIQVRDIVLAMGACTNSAYVRSFHLPGDFAPTADFTLLCACADEARRSGLKTHIGNVLSSDVFYGDESGLPEEQTALSLWGKMGVLAVEMEAAALYMNAARLKKRALALLTVSDSLLTGEALSAKERQNSFTDMVTLALLTAVRLEREKTL